MKLSEGEVYPGDEKCSLICDACIALQNQQEQLTEEQ